LGLHSFAMPDSRKCKLQLLQQGAPGEHVPVSPPQVPLAWQVTRGVPVKPKVQVPTQELPTLLFLGQLKFPLAGLAGFVGHVTAAATAAHSQQAVAYQHDGVSQNCC
jgi:hypothetical protein